MKRERTTRRSPGGPVTGSTPVEVQRITAAGASRSADLSERTRRYVIQMSVRVVCFVGAVSIEHWARWVLLVGAVVLPYVAVVLANGAGGRGGDPGTFLPPAGPRALPGGVADRGSAPAGPRP